MVISDLSCTRLFPGIVYRLQVVRRYLLTWDEGDQITVLLKSLAGCEVEEVGRAQHARLLRLLVDEVLGCEDIRQVLTQRLEEFTDIATSHRAEMAEERRKIRELDEAARDKKRKRREEELAAAQVGKAFIYMFVFHPFDI